MDNQLDHRLRRLEASLEQQGQVLEGQGRQLDEVASLLGAVIRLLMPKEPTPPLHEVLERLTGAIAANTAATARTAAAVERLGMTPP